MKKYLLICYLILVSTSAFPAGADTTFSSDLDSDGKKETIKLTCSSYEYENHAYVDGNYKLSVSGTEVSDSFEYAADIIINIVDVDKRDGMTNIAVVALQDVDNTYRIYEYSSGKLRKTGEFVSLSEPVFRGDGTILHTHWMGFWEAEKIIKYNEASGKFELQKKDSYNVKMFSDDSYVIEVTVPFRLRMERSDDAVVSGEPKIGAVLKILKADIHVACGGKSEEESYDCHWYYVTASTGEKGWVRLKDFQENVSGLPWAG